MGKSRILQEGQRLGPNARASGFLARGRGREFLETPTLSWEAACPRLHV